LLRSRIQQARVHLGGQARALCANLRAELRHEAAGVPRGGVDAFCSRAHQRSTQVAAEFDATLSTALPRLVGLPAGPFSASAPACPALESYLPRFGHPRSDDRLAVLLSVGFGLGVTFTVGRSLVYLVPAWWPAVVAGCIAAGIALTFWVIRTRSLLAERAALDRWSAELAAGLRAALDDQLVIQLLAVGAGWFPVSGYGEPGAGWLTRLHHLLMPALVLGTLNSALIIRFTRASMLDILGEDYIRTARSKGLTESTVVLKHALRNALVPILTVLGLTLALMIGGAVVTETVFNLPGLGNLVVRAVLRRDYPVIQGALLVIAGIYVIINFTIDVLYVFVDPRVRHG
jgi:ABC-type proline/glycine betaine transport system permease subunit